MTPEQISYLAFLTSIVSLVVAFLALYRDRHIVSVRAVPVGNLDGSFNLNVSVANSGKRPISVNHVLIKPPSHPGLFLNFAPKGENRIDVGESRSCQINPSSLSNLPFSWRSVKELRTFDIFVQDALGKKHKAVWEGSGKS